MVKNSHYSAQIYQGLLQTKKLVHFFRHYICSRLLETVDAIRAIGTFISTRYKAAVDLNEVGGLEGIREQ